MTYEICHHHPRACFINNSWLAATQRVKDRKINPQLKDLAALLLVEERINYKWWGASATPCFLWRGKGSRVRKATHTFLLGQAGREKWGGCSARATTLHGKQQHTNPEGLSAEPTSEFLTLSVQTSTVNSEHMLTKYIQCSSGLHTITYWITRTFLNNLWGSSRIVAKSWFFYGETTVGRKKFLGTMKSALQKKEIRFLYLFLPSTKEAYSWVMHWKNRKNTLTILLSPVAVRDKNTNFAFTK